MEEDFAFTAFGEIGIFEVKSGVHVYSESSCVSKLSEEKSFRVRPCEHFRIIAYSLKSIEAFTCQGLFVEGDAIESRVVVYGNGASSFCEFDSFS